MLLFVVMAIADLSSISKENEGKIMCKKSKLFSVLLICMIVSVMCVGYIVTKGAGATKSGNYCKISAAYGNDSSSTNFYLAEGTNLTTSTKMMTVSLQAYYPNGSLYDSTNVSLNTSAGGVRQRTLYNVPITCNTYAQTTIYAGTSISTTQLETLRVQVN